MRTLEKYICDICGHEFGSREKCEECEQSHVLMHSKKYSKGLWNCREKYPCKIDILFEDGKVVRYRR